MPADAREVLQSVAKGQHGMLDPAFLSDGYVSRLRNVTVRNGLAESRWPLVGTDLPVQGKFQGAFEYQLNSQNRLVVVVSGEVWIYKVTDKTWANVYTFPTRDFDRATFVKADRYCIVQNGISAPVENWPCIIHEDTVVDNLATEYISSNALVKVSAHAKPETIRVPIGGAMAYGHGRLFVAVDRFWDNGVATGTTPHWSTDNGFRFWLAGNIAKVDNIQELLVFTESEYLNEGQAMGLPAELGFITSMTMFRNSPTGSGLGALVIQAQRGAMAFAVNVARRQWKSQDIGQVLFTSTGSLAGWSPLQVNSDIVYVGTGGELRTIKYTASNETSSGGLASVGLSPEVENLTRSTLPAHEPWVTTASADNYLAFTAGGVELEDGSVAFKGAAVWDLATFQVSGEAPNRVFPGLWAGGLLHALVGLRDPDGYSLGAIYRESAAGSLKLGYFDTTTYSSTQVSSIQSRSFTFNDPLAMKRFKHADVMFDRMQGTSLKVWIKWRVNGQGAWTTSQVRSFTAAPGSAAATGMFRIPVANINHTAVGYFIQFAVEWQGHARFRYAVFTSSVMEMFSGDAANLCKTVDLAPVSSDDEFTVTLPTGVSE